MNRNHNCHPLYLYTPVLSAILTTSHVQSREIIWDVPFGFIFVCCSPNRNKLFSPVYDSAYRFLYILDSFSCHLYLWRQSLARSIVTQQVWHLCSVPAEEASFLFVHILIKYVFVHCTTTAPEHWGFRIHIQMKSHRR